MMLLLHYLVMSAFRDKSCIVRGHCLSLRQLDRVHVCVWRWIDSAAV